MTWLNGLTALVTGAARGIGAAAALRLAADGASVAVLDLDEGGCAATAALVESRGGRAVPVTADVTDAGQVGKAVAAVVDEFGALEILVNNAGITRDNLLQKMTESDWEDVMAVHLRGMFLTARAVQRHMSEQRYGKIVNLSAATALGNRGQANYAAASAGVQGLTRSLAIELGPFGINVNAVAPGFIATELTARSARRLGVPHEHLQERVAEGTPLQRVGRPEDVAAAIAFLASDQASFITGQTIYLDGGLRL
ncbi:glucose 1-dehydrogenase [Spirillospora sp. NPDC029432]|uniref:glucose 1-dehydrogenase n=1 Tax=Spirillospora sp. NPDC029432 TaxID=3154599 RepID=UPI0034543D6B